METPKSPAPKGCMPSLSRLFGFGKRRPRKADPDNSSNPARATRVNKAEQRAEIASTISTLHAAAAAVPGPVAAGSGAERRPSEATLSTVLWFNGLGKYAVAVELAAAKFNDLPPGMAVPPTVALAAAAGLSDAVLMGSAVGMPAKKVARFRKVFGPGPLPENGSGTAIAAGAEEEKTSMPRATASEQARASSHMSSSSGNGTSTSSSSRNLPATPQKDGASGGVGGDDVTIIANRTTTTTGDPASRSPPGARGGSLPLFDQDFRNAPAPRSPPQPRSASQPLPHNGDGGGAAAGEPSTPSLKPRRSAVRSARKTMARATGMSGFLSGKAKH